MQPPGPGIVWGAAVTGTRCWEPTRGGAAGGPAGGPGEGLRMMTVENLVTADGWMGDNICMYFMSLVSGSGSKSETSLAVLF